MAHPETPEPSGKIATLDGRPFVDPRQSNAEIVALLEEALERARSGETKAVLVVEDFVDDAVQWRRRGHIGYGVLGAFQMALARLRDVMREEGF